MTADTLRFSCPACDVQLDVPVSLAGVTGPCPTCQMTITAPPMSEPIQEPTPEPTPTPQPQAEPTQTVQATPAEAAPPVVEAPLVEPAPVEPTPVQPLIQPQPPAPTQEVAEPPISAPQELVYQTPAPEPVVQVPEPVSELTKKIQPVALEQAATSYSLPQTQQETALPAQPTPIPSPSGSEPTDVGGFAELEPAQNFESQNPSLPPQVQPSAEQVAPEPSPTTAPPTQASQQTEPSAAELGYTPTQPAPTPTQPEPIPETYQTPAPQPAPEAPEPYQAQAQAPSPQPEPYYQAPTPQPEPEPVQAPSLQQESYQTPTPQPEAYQAPIAQPENYSLPPQLEPEVDFATPPPAISGREPTPARLAPEAELYPTTPPPLPPGQAPPQPEVGETYVTPARLEPELDFATPPQHPAVPNQPASSALPPHLQPSQPLQSQVPDYAAPPAQQPVPEPSYQKAPSQSPQHENDFATPPQLEPNYQPPQYTEPEARPYTEAPSQPQPPALDTEHSQQNPDTPFQKPAAEATPSDPFGQLKHQSSAPDLEQFTPPEKKTKLDTPHEVGPEPRREREPAPTTKQSRLPYLLITLSAFILTVLCVIAVLSYTNVVGLNLRSLFKKPADKIKTETPKIPTQNTPSSITTPREPSATTPVTPRTPNPLRIDPEGGSATLEPLPTEIQNAVDFDPETGQIIPPNASAEEAINSATPIERPSSNSEPLKMPEGQHHRPGETPLPFL